MSLKSKNKATEVSFIPLLFCDNLQAELCGVDGAH